MAPKIFLTGATGYIGGSVFATLVKRHPEYDITVLLRTPPSDFSVKFPGVKVVVGDYDSADLISKTAAEADIVIHNGNSDHVKSLQAIISGLVSRKTISFLIHLSGTGILSDFKNSEYRGRLNPKVYSDIDEIDEITSFPDDFLHRKTDKIIQDAAVQHGEKLKTAIVCPPDIYGRGHGPGRKQSVYVPALLSETKKIGAPFYTNEGSNTRSFVHIDDLMDLYTTLVEAAAGGGGSVTWGKKGYFFAASQEASQKDIAVAAAKTLRSIGVLSTEETKQVSEDVIAGTMAEWSYPGIGLYMFASNSRSRADRAANELGYKPKAANLFETLEADLKDALR